MTMKPGAEAGKRGDRRMDLIRVVVLLDARNTHAMACGSTEIANYRYKEYGVWRSEKVYEVQTVSSRSIR